jgi:hypothetical protein
MTETKRFSIAKWMLVVVIAAANLALIRANPDWGAPLTMALPMIYLLLYGLTRIIDPPSRPFWMGFEVTGWSVLLLLIAFAFRDPVTVFRPILWLAEKQRISENRPVELVLAYSVIALLYTTPQLLAAGAAGWFASRYRVVIERRPRGGGLEAPEPGEAVAPEPTGYRR